MPLDLIINALQALIGSPAISQKLQRNELVIKLLKQFNLNPDHPPADFEGVYQYTLVEYGVGKPQPCLEIFRQSEIRAAFRQALDQNNPALWMRAGDEWVAQSPLSQTVEQLGLDPRRELAAFATVFIEVAKRSRTPAEVLTNHKLESLHRTIAGVLDRLDRLPTLEGTRTEMARLAAQEEFLLPAASEKSRTFGLAQQLRGWFETLDYTFEPVEVWADGYFEWVINYRISRRQYNRVLVRGIEGVAQMSDVLALAQSVVTQRADEGWLVTTRRISPAARTEVAKPENAHLVCYTFDELLDQDADFSGYLDWLETEIQRRKIATHYVPLACVREELDPATGHRIAVSRYGAQDGWIDGYIDQWLDDPAKEHISVLGEFGTGKTWFALHYAWVALQRYRDAQKRGVDRPRLPLVIPLRDYAKAVSVESLFSEFFFRKHEIPIPGYSAFEQLNRMGKLLLIFDGFDEMAARVDRQEMINNFWELAKIVVPGAKVILTCRTEHFPEIQEGRSLLNAELKASTTNQTEDMPQFEVLELEKFDDDQIQQVLALQANPDVVQQVMGNPQLLDLVRRPVMTELILEALPDIVAGKPIDMSRMYLYAVQRKMERDIKAERTFTSLADKLYFLCELSWEMLSSDRMSLNYREFPDRIRRLFGAVVQEERDLDHWQYDMMGQTMLIRNAAGDYMPAHRSLLEFFVAYKFAAELGALAPDFLTLAQMQSHLDRQAEPQDYVWSDYFGSTETINGAIVPIPPLRAFVSESLVRLRATLGRTALTKAVLDLLLPMLDPALMTDPQPLLDILQATQDQSIEEVGYVGGNVATLLVKLNDTILEGQDLSRTVVRDANFTNASLRDVNFTAATLQDSSFTQCLGSVLSVVFSLDGEILATGDTNGEIHLRRVVTGEQMATFEGHTDWVRSIALSPDGKLLASGSSDRAVKVWDFQTGECLHTLTGHTDWLRAVAFHPDGQLLASSSGDHTIRFWDVGTGECRQILRGHTGSVHTVAFSPNGQMMASAGGGDHAIHLWDVLTGECCQILTGHRDSVYSVVFSPNGQRLASGGRNGDPTLYLWDVATGECLKTFPGHTHSVCQIAFSSDGQTLVSGSFDRTIRLWNVSTGDCLKVLQGHCNWIRSISFAPDQQTLASGGDDQTARLWDMQTGECVKIFQGYHHLVLSVALSPDGQTLASGSNDGAIRFWHPSTYECYKILQGPRCWVSNLAFSADGQILVSGSADTTIRLWNLQTYDCVKTVQGDQSSWVMPSALSTDQRILVFGSGSNLNVWDLEANCCLHILEGHTKWIKGIAFTADQQTIVSGSDDTTIKLWHVETGACLQTLTGHDDRIWAIALSPDDQQIASSSSDGTVKLWQMSTGECLQTFRGHDNQVRSVAFSPDGQIIASGSYDRTIKLWDTKTGDCYRTLEGHANWVVSVAFSPDGHSLASAAEDGTLRLWDSQTGTCLKILRPERPYERMNITGVKGLTLTEIATLKALGAVENEEFRITE
jgi:WD40 repeat protein